MDINTVDPDFLVKLLVIMMVVGKIVQSWQAIMVRGKPRPMKVEDQPVEVIEGWKPASIDHIKVVHHRLDEHGRRLEILEAARETDKQEIVDEIIKMREQSHEQFATLNRAIGRLEGSRLQD